MCTPGALLPPPLFSSFHCSPWRTERVCSWCDCTGVASRAAAGFGWQHFLSGVVAWQGVAVLARYKYVLHVHHQHMSAPCSLPRMERTPAYPCPQHWRLHSPCVAADSAGAGLRSAQGLACCWYRWFPFLHPCRWWVQCCSTAATTSSPDTNLTLLHGYDRALRPWCAGSAG